MRELDIQSDVPTYKEQHNRGKLEAVLKGTTTKKFTELQLEKKGFLVAIGISRIKHRK